MDYLENFAGAVIAVSHDRYFLDKMATEIFEFKDGQCIRYNGNYSDYAEKAFQSSFSEAVKSKKKSDKKERTYTGKTKLKFSFKEQREYETIDDDIAKLEQMISDIEKEITENSSDYIKLQELSDKKTELETELEFKMERWVYLNDLAERIAKGEMI